MPCRIFWLFFSDFFLFRFRVIIGAPRADTSRIQPNVTQGGAVYRCDIFDDNRCHLIPFDSAGESGNGSHSFENICLVQIIIDENKIPINRLTKDQATQPILNL